MDWNEDAERALIEKILVRWRAEIDTACSGQGVNPSGAIPPEFLAALIAGESGGDPIKTRFEGGVAMHLRLLREGKIRTWGGIPQADVAAASDDRLEKLATSYGLTQIMGYHEMFVAGRDPQALLRPMYNLLRARQMLLAFARRWNLQLHTEADFRLLLTCWNSGRPDGKTCDPDYAERGARRMALAHDLAQPMLAKTPVIMDPAMDQ